MWKRRDLLGVMATGAAGMALFTNPTEAAATGPLAEDPKHAAMMKSCSDKCADCALACNKAFHHCLKEAVAGKSRHAGLAQVVADCAAFCGLSLEMMSRHSNLMVLSCRACADACQICAGECESLDTDLDMKLCIDACRRCEESCREMVKMLGR